MVKQHRAEIQQTPSAEVIRSESTLYTIIYNGFIHTLPLLPGADLYFHYTVIGQGLTASGLHSMEGPSNNLITTQSALSVL